MITCHFHIESLLKIRIPYSFCFLISTPLGLALNAVSYLLLDGAVHWFEKIIFLKALFYKNDNNKMKSKVCTYAANLIKTTAVDEFLWNMCRKKRCRDMFCKDGCRESDKIYSDKIYKVEENPKNFMEFTDCIAAMMQNNQRKRYEMLHGYEVGVHIFFRNLALISLIDILLFIIIGYALSLLTLFLLVLLFLFLIFSAFVSYYYRLDFLCDAYIFTNYQEKGTH